MNKNLGSEEVHLDNEKYPSSNNLSPYKFNIDEEKVELKKRRWNNSCWQKSCRL